jgi:protein-S-isoprenylcysteine O-methyltransferase Ste14
MGREPGVMRRVGYVVLDIGPIFAILSPFGALMALSIWPESEVAIGALVVTVGLLLLSAVVLVVVTVTDMVRESWRNSAAAGDADG